MLMKSIDFKKNQRKIQVKDEFIASLDIFTIKILNTSAQKFNTIFDVSLIF